MELRLYWHVLRRRLWIVLLLLVVFLTSYTVARPNPTAFYVARMRFVIGLRPEHTSGEYYSYDRYYTWLTAEYLIDDFAEVTKSRVFAQDVASVAALDVPVGAIQGATSAGKLHRILGLQVTWPDEAQLGRIADAVVAVMESRADSYFAQLGTDSAVISLIDPPSIAAVGPSLRQRLDLPIRAILAIGLGVALTFLLDYWDDSVRDRRDLDELHLPLLAEIPSRRSWLALAGRRRPSP